MAEHQSTGIVAGCVLEKDGKYLLVQERKEVAYGKWNLPAGRVDVGETIEQAAIREVREESGYEVELETELRVEHDAASYPVVLHSYKAKIIGGELEYRQDELLDARWYAIEEIEALHREAKLRVDWVINSIYDCQALMNRG